MGIFLFALQKHQFDIFLCLKLKGIVVNAFQFYIIINWHSRGTINKLQFYVIINWHLRGRAINKL